MADWALSDYSRSEAGVATAPRASTAHTKAAWVQVIAATQFAYDRLSVQIQGFIGSAAAILCDIGIGAPGSEFVLIANAAMGLGSQGVGGEFDIPLRVPAGSRIAVRHQESTGSGTRTLICGITGYAGGFKSGTVRGRTITYGANTSTSSGVAVAPSATGNVWGAWTEIAAATTEHHAGLVMCMGLDGATRTNNFNSTEFGIGPSGGEVMIASRIDSINSTNPFPGLLHVPISIPAGTRIAARHMTPANNQSAISVVCIGY